MNSSDPVGTVRTLRRFPVKSMLGEQVDVVDVGEGGIVGDRAYAVRDRQTGKVASAKNPKLRPGLLACRAASARRSAARRTTCATTTCRSARTGPRGCPNPRWWPKSAQFYRIGPGGDATDIDGRWAAITQITPEGALLVRPDAFVGWRT